MFKFSANIGCSKRFCGIAFDSDTNFRIYVWDNHRGATPYINITKTSIFSL